MSSQNLSQDLKEWVRKDLTAHIGNLEGQWLTIVDATFSDREQRKAMKDIVRKMIWDWDTKIVEDVCPYSERKTAGVDQNGRPTF